MKLLFCFLACLFAAVGAQYPTIINSPRPGDTIIAGQNVKVQFLVPLTIGADHYEVGAAIGIVSCGKSSCPPASQDIGQVLYAGPLNLTLRGHNLVDEINVQVPNNLKGKASIQILRAYVTSSRGQPSTSHVDFRNVQVNVASQSALTSPFVIHPSINNQVCVGISGGKYTDNALVDVFKCDNSNTQEWQFNGTALVSVNPIDGSQYCVDAGVPLSGLTNGQQVRINKCLPHANLPQQRFIFVSNLHNAIGAIRLAEANFCLNLPNGDTSNGNILQLSQCASGDVNQVWRIAAAPK